MCGCAVLYAGRFPEPASAPPRAAVTPLGFEPDMSFIGVVVPLVPVGGRFLESSLWPRSDAPWGFWLNADPKSLELSFAPGGIRATAGGRECRPTAAWTGSDAPVADLAQPLALRSLQVAFGDCPVPEDAFDLDVEGFPRIHYERKFDIMFHYVPLQ